MAIDGAEVRQICSSHLRASDALNRGETKAAATIVCKELSRILESESFWQDLRAAMPAINGQAAAGRDVLGSLNQLLEDEERALKKLGLSGQEAQDILINVFSAVTETTSHMGDHKNVTAQNLRILERDLGRRRSSFVRPVAASLRACEMSS